MPPKYASFLVWLLIIGDIFLLLPDEVLDKLAGSRVFSTLTCTVDTGNCQSILKIVKKTAFCPGPGLGLYEFCRMPFGLSGAFST